MYKRQVRLSRQLPFYLRTGVSFINKGYEVNGFDDSRTTMNYIQIPVGIDYTVALGKHFAFIPFAGLYYAVGIGGKREGEDEKISIFKKEGGFSRHDMGVSCGVDAAFGASLSERITIQDLSISTKPTRCTGKITTK